MGADNQEKRPRVGVAVCVEKDGKILLGKRKGAHGAGEWSCPGGHLDFGESVEECAVRELAEETGLKALSLELGPWTNDIFDDTRHYISLFVFVHEFEGELQLLEPDKCEGWQWFSWDSLPEPLFSSVKAFLQKVCL